VKDTLYFGVFVIISTIF